MVSAAGFQPEDRGSTPLGNKVPDLNIYGGDKVTELIKVKPWGYMAQEYGLDPDTGDIRILPSWTKEMEQALPEDRVIEVNGSWWQMTPTKAVSVYVFGIVGAYITEGERWKKLATENVLKQTFRNTISSEIAQILPSISPTLTVKDVGLYGLWRSHTNPEHLGYLNIKDIPEDVLRNPSYISYKTLQTRHGVHAKAGKIFRKILLAIGKDGSTKEIEDLLKKFAPPKLKLEVVSGEDIRYWYHEKRHAQTLSIGTLGKSCMRYDDCQEYLDIYVANPEVCQLLIGTVQENGVKKIAARALLWTSTDGRKFIDRIYAASITAGQLERYGAENGYLKVYGVAVEGDSPTIAVNGEHEYYPYLDSFYGLNSAQNMLFLGGSWYTLQDMDGDPLNNGPTCDICGDRYDDLTETESGDYVCAFCLGSYRYLEHEDVWIHEGYVATCDDCGEYYRTEDIHYINTADGERGVCESCLGDYIEVDDVYYQSDEVEWCEVHLEHYVEDECPLCKEEREQEEEENEKAKATVEVMVEQIKENKDEKTV